MEHYIFTIEKGILFKWGSKMEVEMYTDVAYADLIIDQ